MLVGTETSAISVAFVPEFVTKWRQLLALELVSKFGFLSTDLTDFCIDEDWNGIHFDLWDFCQLPKKLVLC